MKLWNTATALAAFAGLAGLAAPGAVHAQDATLARNLAATCTTCHGTNGNARGDMKVLAGMPADTIVALLNGYKSGTVTGTIMHQLAKGYTDEQIKLIAGHFAAQKPKP